MFKRLIKRVYIIPVVIVSFLVVILWPNYQTIERSPLPQVQETVTANKRINEPIQPIPLEIKLDEKKVALGDKLFNERHLSRNNSISCASCHNLSTGGVDRLVYSYGINGHITPRNTQTVFNSGFDFWQGWDGGAATLAEIIEKSVFNPMIMNSNWPEIINKLLKSPEYVKAFAQVYHDSITGDNIKDAIAAFCQSLYTPNSRFDKFLRGHTNALTYEEKAGYRIFKKYGCASCHQGVNVGGNLFQKFGATVNYFDKYEKISETDFGRFNITKMKQIVTFLKYLVCEI